MQDFVGTDREQITAALALANQALGQIECDLKHLEQRAAQLREWIRLGDAMLGTASVDAQALPRVVPVRQNAAQQALAVLRETGHALSPEEVYLAIARRNAGEETPTKSAVQKALRDNRSIFRSAGYGIYGLKEWTQPATVAG